MWQASAWNMTKNVTTRLLARQGGKIGLAERDRKLEAARERRKQKRHAARQAALDSQPDNATT